MGCVYSNENKEAAKRSKEIDKNMRIDFQKDNSVIKILLLGAGESGKSTIIKQMKIIHNNGYTIDETLQYKPIVFSNTIQSLTAIIRAMGHLRIEFSDPDRIEDARRVFALGNTVDTGSFNHELLSCVQRLWNDDGVKACFMRSREYQLNDSAEYYLNSLERLAESDYIPTVQDVLHTRVKTTGIIETEIDYKNLKLKIVDVGGQRSERRKWIHCFEGVTTMIFVVAISEYDQFLIEDNEINRMYESLKLFDSVCNNQWFIKSSIILFLNKVDIFKQKITLSSLNVCFPEYNGKDNFEESSDYIRSKFEILNRKKGKILFTHFTCATDTSNITHVFNVVIDNLIFKNVENIGIF